MAYLSSDAYDHDIFISYAHVDDEPLPGAGQGWVTTFTTCVKTKLAQKLGRNDAYSLWMDYELRGGQPITPHILGRVRRSAMLLVVLSPGYVASDWCRRELETFAGFISEGQERRVFVVELDPLNEAERPPHLADLKRSRFWTANRISGTPRPLGNPVLDAEYYSAVDDLIREIVTELKGLKSAEPRSAAATPLTSNGTVFLAEVTDDLEEQRNNVKRYLDQAGIAVLPKTGCSLHPDAFRQAVTEGLGEADLFVQLLSALPGKRPPDLSEGYAKCQMQLALSLGKPVLQWRSPALDMSAVQDAAQRLLLDAATVRAEGIEDFKREIRRRLDERQKEPLCQAPTDAFVFVDMDSTTDRPLAEQLCDILGQYNAGYMLPTEDQDPRKFRKDLREKLLSCNALILIYGATTRSWVDGHLKELQKMLSLRPPLRGLAIVEGPPDPKDRLSIMLPKMKVINCRGGVKEAEVSRFLESLDTRVS
jgi:hypothetical protein